MLLFGNDFKLWQISEICMLEEIRSLDVVLQTKHWVQNLEDIRRNHGSKFSTFKDRLIYGSDSLCKDASDFSIDIIQCYDEV